MCIFLKLTKVCLDDALRYIESSHRGDAYLRWSNDTSKISSSNAFEDQSDAHSALILDMQMSSPVALSTVQR